MEDTNVLPSQFLDDPNAFVAVFSPVTACALESSGHKAEANYQVSDSVTVWFFSRTAWADYLRLRGESEFKAWQTYCAWAESRPQGAAFPVKSAEAERRVSEALSVAEMIHHAQTTPQKPVLDGLLKEQEIAGLHGPAEVFKTMFCLQLAESLAAGTPLLGIWPVTEKRRVFLIETEMSPEALGERLARMYATRVPPDGLRFASKEQLRRFRRAAGLDAKFEMVCGWLKEAESEAIILDTANPFFRGKENPNEETHVGRFFDRFEALPGVVKLFSRHNRKPRYEEGAEPEGPQIRGSGQWIDVPDLLIELRRRDKRINKAVLDVSKFRGGMRPEPVTLWFDPVEFRLTPLPAAIYLLLKGPLTRQQLLDAMQRRFGVSQKLVDTLIAEQRGFLFEKMLGHDKAFQIDLTAAKDAPWFAWLSEGYGGELHKVV